MFITDEKVTEYINKFYMPLNIKLDKLRKKCEEDNIPLILRETESFLQILIRIKKPSKILEIGTAYGYSASFFASITTNAEIHTIEKDNELYKIARENIKQIGVNDRIKCIFGDALTVLDELRYPRCDNMEHYKYDMVFIDGAKSRYKEIFDKSIELCDKNALIICDNVLLKGSIADNKFDARRRHRTNIKRMKEFIDYINSKANITSSLVSCGDGLLISILN